MANRRQTNPSNAQPQTVVLDTAGTYRASVSDQVIEVQAAGVTVVLPPNPVVGSTLLELVPTVSFSLSGGANPLSSDPQTIPGGASVLAAFSASGWLIANTSGGLPNTFKYLNSASPAYTALSTDILIEADLSTGALAGPINIGANAVLLRKITVVDLTWSVNGANLLIPVTGGAVPIQDPNTGAFVTGTVQIKQQGAQVAWIYDGTRLALTL